MKSVALSFLICKYLKMPLSALDKKMLGDNSSKHKKKGIEKLMA